MATRKKTAEEGQLDRGRNPSAPAQLRPNAIPDARFPMNFEAPIPEAVRALMHYFASLCRRDPGGIADSLHFPFASFERTAPIIVEKREDLLRNTPPSINTSEHPERFSDHDGYLEPGCYDTFEGLEVLNASAICVNLSLSYNRYDRTGHHLLRCDGVYCITNNNGRWAIQAMSTIFTPALALDIEYRDTIDKARRLRFDHCLAYMVNDEEAVWGPIRQYGVNVGAGAAVNPRSAPSSARDSTNFSGGGVLWRDAPVGKAMEFFRTEGVMSRLSVTHVTPESLAQSRIDFDAYRAVWPKTGVGNWGWVIGGASPARVLHATVDKAHVFQGAARFTTAGAFINDSLEVDIVTYRKGRWGIAGIFGYGTRQDRSNDMAG
jgi:hypothetical protein